jgi:hypothetical protein
VDCGISYEGLVGRYLHQGTYLDLIRSGYIGAHADKTAEMKTLVEVVLKDNRAIVGDSISGHNVAGCTRQRFR